MLVLYYGITIGIPAAMLHSKVNPGPNSSRNQATNREKEAHDDVPSTSALTAIKTVSLAFETWQDAAAFPVKLMHHCEHLTISGAPLPKAFVKDLVSLDRLTSLDLSECMTCLDYNNVQPEVCLPDDFCRYQFKMAKLGCLKVPRRCRVQVCSHGLTHCGAVSWTLM